MNNRTFLSFLRIFTDHKNAFFRPLGEHSGTAIFNRCLTGPVLLTFRFYQPPSPTGMEIWGRATPPLTSSSGATTPRLPISRRMIPPHAATFLCVVSRHKVVFVGCMKHLSLERRAGLSYTSVKGFWGRVTISSWRLRGEISSRSSVSRPQAKQAPHQVTP